jgi:hypothetical protein
MADPELPGRGRAATPDDDSKVVSRLADALESLRTPGRTDGALWRSAGGVLRTEWKYLLIGVMILVGHFKYHLSLLYYAHELAHAQEEHIVADNQREANGKILQHHVDLGNSLFGDGEMRGAESEFREALKLDGTNLEAERGLFKASIFNEWTTTRASARPPRWSSSAGSGSWRARSARRSASLTPRDRAIHRAAPSGSRPAPPSAGNASRRDRAR